MYSWNFYLQFYPLKITIWIPWMMFDFTTRYKGQFSGLLVSAQEGNQLLQDVQRVHPHCLHIHWAQTQHLWASGLLMGTLSALHRSKEVKRRRSGVLNNILQPTSLAFEILNHRFSVLIQVKSWKMFSKTSKMYANLWLFQCSDDSPFSFSWCPDYCCFAKEGIIHSV